MDSATLSCEWTNQRAGSQLNMHTYDDTRRSIFCVNRDCLIFEVHQIISWLLRDFFIFSSKKRTFLAKYRLFGEKEDLICVFCLKYVSENHTMVEFEINTPRSNKILPSVLPKYSSRRREYFGRTRGSILLLRGVFIKIFIEWWSRKTPRRQPRGFSCHHEMNIAPN